MFNHGLYNQQCSASLIIRSDGIGGWHCSGDSEVALGYSLSDDSHANDEGVWVRWNWDGSKLIVRNDRFGFLPVYYSVLSDGIAVSTSVMTLMQAGVSSTLDDAAIAVFLRLGHYIGEDTPFKAIKTLAPGTQIAWQNRKITFRSLHPPLATETSTLSRPEAVQAYGEVFQQAVESMLPDTDEGMVVPLTAGRDSRHILYAITRAGRKPEAVITARSMPPRPDNDAHVAARIAEALSLNHEVVEQSDNRFSDELAKNSLTDFCSDEHVQMMPIARWLSSNNANITWDGIAGDIISCGVYDDSRMITQFRNHDYASLCGWLLGESAYLKKCLSASAMTRWSRELATERLTVELKKYAHLPNPAAAYFFYNRVRRELAMSPYSILNKQCQVLSPYLNHKLFDLLINLPFEYFKGREFHSEAIDQFYPELPQLPYKSVHEGFLFENPKKTRKFSNQFIGMVLSKNTAPSSVRKHRIIPRLAKGLLDKEHGTLTPNLFARILVVMQLEQTVGSI